MEYIQDGMMGKKHTDFYTMFDSPLILFTTHILKITKNISVSKELV